MMAEYIDREAVVNLLRAEAVRGATPYHIGLYAAARAVEYIPAADVREVVLCKECVHFQKFRPHDGFCKIDGMLWNNDFFCANGRKREEG